MKKVLSLVLSMVVAAGILGGCSSSSEDSKGASGANTVDTTATGTTTGSSESEVSESTEPVVFKAAGTSAIGSLYPWGVNNGTRQAVRGLTFEPLFYRDSNNELHGILAKEYEYKGDGVYEITLFDYIKDSQGNPMTAADVIFSIDKWKEDGKGAQNYGALTDYKQTGDYTLTMTFGNNKIEAFERCVTYCYCVTQAAWEASPDGMTDTPVGTGRYEVVDFVSDSYYIFEKRDNYWQTDETYICEKNRGTVDRFEWSIVADGSTLAVALESGEIDFATKEIVQADRANFINEDGSAKDGYSVLNYTTTSNVRLVFNCSENSPCSDINLRYAICHAIDAEAIAQNVQGVYGTAGSSSFVDLTDTSGDTSGYYAYDVELAKEYLTKSGYQGESIKILVKPNENTWNSAILIEAYLRAIGVNVELIEYETALYNSTRADETGTVFDIDLAGGTGSIENIWQQFIELDVNQYATGVNHLMISDDTLQQLYNTAAAVDTASDAATKELVDYVDEQCYLYNIFYFDIQFVGNDKIKNMVIDRNLECIFSAFTVE